MKSKNILVGFDGACEPVNPGGTASWGYWITGTGGDLVEDHGVIGTGPGMSNNVAEYRALREALEWLGRMPSVSGLAVKVRGDSMLVIQQMSGRWKAKGGLYLDEYRRTLKARDALRQRGVQLLFEWIPREQNERADVLSKAHLGPVSPASLPDEYLLIGGVLTKIPMVPMEDL